MYSDYPEIEDVAKKTKNLCSKIENEEIKNDIKELVTSIVILVAKERNLVVKERNLVQPIPAADTNELLQLMKKWDGSKISMREIREGFI